MDWGHPWRQILQAFQASCGSRGASTPYYPWRQILQAFQPVVEAGVLPLHTTLCARFYRLFKHLVEAGVLSLHTTCCQILTKLEAWGRQAVHRPTKEAFIRVYLYYQCSILHFLFFLNHHCEAIPQFFTFHF